MTTPVRDQRTRDDRQELTALITAATAQLTRTWAILHTSQTTLLQQLERIVPGRAVGQTRRIRTALADFNATVAEYDRQARALAERWTAQDLPIAYRDGAIRALQAAERDAALFTWTADHQAAVAGLTAPFWADLIRRITEAVRRAQAFARAAQDAVRATSRVDTVALLEAHPLDTVIYADKARHPVHSWAHSALSWQGVVTANHGAINTTRLELGAEWMEVRDGPECGWVNHPDTDHADGTIRSLEECATYPSAHHGCVAEGTEVQSLGALGSAYRLRVSGGLVQIRTSGGRRLSVTPNHPILTGRGWVPAGEVEEGDQVLVRSGESSSVSTAPDLYQMPAAIEDVFAALREVLPDDRVVPTAHDFHGDGSIVDGKVDVVGAEGELWCVEDAAATQDLPELGLEVADTSTVALPRESHALPLLKAVHPATSSLMSGVRVRRVGALMPDLDAVFFDAASEGCIADAEFVREAERRFAISVALDDVIEVRNLDSSSAHVYDLSTTSHAYFANGILVHNCIREFYPRPDLTGRADIESGDPA